jgi:hypothetical protein
MGFHIRKDLPVAIHVPVPIYASGEPGFLEGCDEDGKIRVAHDRVAQGRRGRCEVYHHHARLGRRRRQVVAEQVAQEAIGVGIQHSVRDTGLTVEVDEIVAWKAEVLPLHNARTVLGRYSEQIGSSKHD